MNQREIKFRAWDKNGKEMFDWKDCVEYLELGDLNEKTKTSAANYLVFMEFTGLKDWHKNEIYEGDIIKFTYNERTGVICESENEVVENLWDIRNHCWDKGVDYDDIKVIGNKYQNPELLK